MISEKNRILTLLFKSSEIQQTINKFNPEDLREDLLQETFLILSSKDDQFIINLNQKGDLLFYAIRIIINVITSTKNSFYEKFRKDRENTKFVGLQPFKNRDNVPTYITKKTGNITKHIRVEDNNYDESFDILHEEVNNAINNIDPYYGNLLRLYFEYKTYRNVAEATKDESGKCIHYSSVHAAVKIAKEMVREKHKELYSKN